MADHAAKTGINLDNGVYDVIRILVEKVLPALGVFYYTIAHIWKLPHADEVAATFAAIAVLLGVVLTLSRRVYNDVGKYDGAVVEGINEAGQPVLKLELDPSSAEDLLNKKQLVFKGFDPTA